uniref:Uncharacterized protein n=1 Tax=Globisporangium ultimum (strain ATCC 200006 / CBS 805.95 / DAOM BR144) TaxID=431595 RepID=K3X572_GLOUD
MDPNKGLVQALPIQLEWYGGQMSHAGPCKVWCGNELVMPFTSDCAASFPQGKIPYSKVKCVGKSRLTLYWMATLLEWQVYIDCAKIGDGRKLEHPEAPVDSAATNATSALHA